MGNVLSRWGWMAAPFHPTKANCWCPATTTASTRPPPSPPSPLWHPIDWQQISNDGGTGVVRTTGSPTDWNGWSSRTSPTMVLERLQSHHGRSGRAGDRRGSGEGAGAIDCGQADYRVSQRDRPRPAVRSLRTFPKRSASRRTPLGKSERSCGKPARLTQQGACTHAVNLGRHKPDVDCRDRRHSGTFVPRTRRATSFVPWRERVGTNSKITNEGERLSNRWCSSLEKQEIKSSNLEISPTRSPRERNHVPNVCHAGRVQNRAFKAQTKSGVGHRCRTSCAGRGTTNTARSQDRTPRCGGPRHPAALRVVIRQ